MAFLYPEGLRYFNLSHIMALLMPPSAVKSISQKSCPPGICSQERSFLSCHTSVCASERWHYINNKNLLLWVFMEHENLIAIVLWIRWIHWEQSLELELGEIADNKKFLRKMWSEIRAFCKLNKVKIIRTVQDLKRKYSHFFVKR